MKNTILWPMTPHTGKHLRRIDAILHPLGTKSRQRVVRIGYAADEEYAIFRGKGHAHIDGFDLHAGEAIRAGDTERLERLLRYVLRPPVAQDRLKLQDDGKILLVLKNPWKNG